MNSEQLSLLNKVVEQVFAFLPNPPLTPEQFAETNLRWQALVQRSAPLSKHLRKDVVAAVIAWDQEEAEYLDRHHVSHNQVCAEFRNFHSLLAVETTGFLALHTTPPFLSELPHHFPVRNILWIRVFQWVLPGIDMLASDAQRERYREIGRIMLASFFIGYIPGRDYHFPEALQTDHFSNLESAYRHSFEGTH